ncbi:MAG: hypothetical protein MRZ61_06195 [Oscillospiraceae bacterium]|nr:hypothetical protein [Oscillospiraceae bacterium]
MTAKGGYDIIGNIKDSAELYKVTKETLINTFQPFFKMSSKVETRTFFKTVKRTLRFNQLFSNYLYNYEDEDNITNLVSWEHETDQWWILAFNPYYSSTDINTENDIDVDKQVMICSIDFSTDIAKYEALKNTTNNKNYEYYNKQAETYLIFDDINSVVWINWYK